MHAASDVHRHWSRRKLRHHHLHGSAWKAACLHGGLGACIGGSPGIWPVGQGLVLLQERHQRNKRPRGLRLALTVGRPRSTRLHLPPAACTSTSACSAATPQRSSQASVPFLAPQGFRPAADQKCLDWRSGSAFGRHECGLAPLAELGDLVFDRLPLLSIVLPLRRSLAAGPRLQPKPRQLHHGWLNGFFAVPGTPQLSGPPVGRQLPDLFAQDGLLAWSS